ncbi:1-aminocyclopropane-1-carboxylate synthase-like protein 1 [Antedon mediterranea]|uniref:1-aminocyclopropane-1-carboxylate synthase-like protein 1 n=1 Tax=Antedon mediterranea TaxID=105859 RepID=UPI003AF86FE0
MSVLSERGKHINTVVSEDLILKGSIKTRENSYHHEKNPTGCINLGPAQNKLMCDVLTKRLSQPDLMVWRDDLFHYYPDAGLLEFRQAIAEFLTDKANAAMPVDPDKVVVINGCGTVLESVAFGLCNSGDAFITPTPYYGGAWQDFMRRANVNIHPIHLYSNKSENETRSFQLTIDKLEKGLEKANKKGLTIRGLFLMNPHNPLGEIYSREMIKDCLQFCHKHSLHIIFDEIYLTGGFVEGVQTTSILQFKPEDIPDPERTHFIWGFSKDFAMSGFRVGLYYGFGSEVKTVIQNQCRFTRFSANMHVVLANMLKDKDWIDNVYMATNQKRLRECYQFVSSKLTLAGIPFLETTCGLFLYADFRKFLKNQSFNSEIDLWNKLLDAGVHLSPSKAFRSDEPGWFRIVFSVPIDQLKIGMERISQVCKEIVTNKS